MFIPMFSLFLFLWCSQRDKILFLCGNLRIRTQKRLLRKVSCTCAQSYKPAGANPSIHFNGLKMMINYFTVRTNLLLLLTATFYILYFLLLLTTDINAQCLILVELYKYATSFTYIYTFEVCLIWRKENTLFNELLKPFNELLVIRSKQK